MMGHSLNNPCLFKEDILNISQSYLLIPTFCFIQKHGVGCYGRVRLFFFNLNKNKNKRREWITYILFLGTGKIRC